MKKILVFLLLCLFVAPCGACKRENEFDFTLIEGKEEYRLSGMKEIYGGEVVVPSEYRGVPVTEIGERAFASETKIKSVYLPDSIVKIGSYAFDDCRNLESLRLPENLEIIPSHMIRNAQIAEIAIPGNVKRIENRSFAAMPFKKVSVPDSVEYIGYEAFYFCGLEDVVIGSGIQEIQPYAFRDCENLKSVVFKNPDNITLYGVSFEEGALNDAGYVASLFLDEQYAARHWFAKNK